VFIEKKLQSGMAWINLDADILSQHPGSYTKYNIDEETIEYALDKNERAHMDYNRETGTVVFIFNVFLLYQPTQIIKVYCFIIGIKWLSYPLDEYKPRLQHCSFTRPEFVNV